MLEKVINIDKVEVLDSGHIQVRTATRVFEDGLPLGAKSYHRQVLSPGDDLTGQDERVAAIAQAAWTPEVVAAYQAKVAAAEAEVKQ